ncbi:MAG TPA: universal stress protein [Pseudonocardiaceae bacterium]|nr:universal stress protein [Pseudonocardiaceae bacterium]
MVGIDGFETGRRALDWALREALIRDCALHVVHAWDFDPVADYFTETSERAVYQESLAMVSREVKQATSGMTNPPRIIENSLQGDPVRVLPEAARGAAMLVVGRHRSGLVQEMLLGSVSAACVRHASCPVVVIPVVMPR